MFHPDFPQPRTQPRGHLEWELQKVILYRRLIRPFFITLENAERVSCQLTTLRDSSEFQKRAEGRSSNIQSYLLYHIAIPIPPITIWKAIDP